MFATAGALSVSIAAPMAETPPDPAKCGRPRLRSPLFAYVSGGSLSIDKSQLDEAYYRWQLGEVFGLTADLQYQQDDYKTGSGPHGWIFGLRATAKF